MHVYVYYITVDSGLKLSIVGTECDKAFSISDCVVSCKGGRLVTLVMQHLFRASPA